MKICYFGDYDPDYSRNKIIIKGLEQNGLEVVLCQSNFYGSRFKKILELYKRHRELNGTYDSIIVGYSDSRFIVPLAKIISRKKVIWDAYYSLFDAWVFDRAKVKEKSIKAKYYWLIDWISCMLSDKILLDTEEHIKYFVDTFKINKNKIVKVLVGSLAEAEGVDLGISEIKDEKFKVFFYGNFIPLQGVPYIVKAAKILENEKDILFQILGRGQATVKVNEIVAEMNIRNVEFFPKTTYAEIIKLIKNSDICLGIFGNTGKASRVIPNKVYDAVALGKAVVTADTPAIKELFEDRKNIILCKVADEQDLAEKILELKNNVELRKKIAGAAYKIFKEKAMPSQVVGRLVEVLKNDYV